MVFDLFYASHKIILDKDKRFWLIYIEFLVLKFWLESILSFKFAI
ncbi:hypothetical protein SAMN04488023_10347 [Pedobacter rhizosphaerae]|uniref:Uncharacterized protein n=1 Tax=Pedobacter rhizosphaerae TaxID=390241 RepID=A0A1H9KLS7_9SPHI|nr:hypothetical protein SAMN04488023_10347 [Pedobacter rhizosphaerae]